MIEIQIIENNKSAYDKVLHGLHIKREIVDHRGKTFGRSYGVPEEAVEKKKTMADVAETLEHKVHYVKGFIKQLKKDGGYLVDGEFKHLTKEDEAALQRKLKKAKKDQAFFVSVEVIYALCVGFVLWHTYLITIPLYALAVMYFSRQVKLGKEFIGMLEDKGEITFKSIAYHAYRLPLLACTLGLVVATLALESVSFKLKKTK